MTYAKFINEKTIDRNPPRRATINGREVRGELPADYLATLGYYPLESTPCPSEDAPEGKHWEIRYAQGEGAVTLAWVAVDNPPPAPRTFSKLKLYAALAQYGLWDGLKAWLESQTFDGINAYYAFSLAQDLTEAHPLFSQWFAAAKTALDVSDEDAEKILAASVKP